MNDRLSDQTANAAQRLSVFEPRLALSVNAADDLIDLFASSSITNAPSTLDPLADAAALRQQTGLDGRGQTVAVIDTGIAWDHVAFAGPNGASGIGPGHRVVGGWDFAENDALPYDDGPAGFHGTHIAGTIAGDANGMQGVAPEVDLVALRVFDDYGRSNLDWIESALRWVIDHRNSFASPITTVNLSLGSFAIDATQSLTQLDDEIRSLHDQGILIFAAAGNSYDANHPDQLAYPASNPLVTAVTSVDTAGNLQAFAQRSSQILATVGAGVRSAIPDHVYGEDGKIDDFATLSGTSMATAELAGASVLVRQALIQSGIEHPTAAQVIEILRSTAVAHHDAGSGIEYKVVDIRSAIEHSLAMAEPTPSGTASFQWDDAKHLRVTGSSDSDEFLVDLSGTMPQITVNGQRLPIDQAADKISIDAGSGSDSLVIIGGDGDERVLAKNAEVSETAANISIERLGFRGGFTGFENLQFRGGGGNDRATFYDSFGDDTLDATSDQVTLRGVGYSFVAVGVNSVYAHATAGGNDVAYLYDSKLDDHLAIRHQFTSLRNADQFRLAYGFEKVFAFAGLGGQDDAALYDSPGDDRMSASSNSVWISGRDYYASATGFANVVAGSSAGGNDYATLYATNPNDHWLRASQYVQWDLGSGASRIAQGFSRMDTFLNMQPIVASTASVKTIYFDLERIATTQFFERYGTESEQRDLF